MFNIKITPSSCGWLPIHHALPNERFEMALVNRLEKLFNLSPLSLGRQFHAAVIQVFHVTRHGKSFCKVAARPSKPDPLHMPAVKDNDALGFHP